MFTTSQLNTNSNSLLSKVVRFLNTKDVSFEAIQNLVNESTTAQLVPSFAFLGVWLSSNASADSMHLATVQIAYHLLHLIATKVPPVILICGLLDLNWTANHPHYTHSMVFLSFFERLQTIRSYVKPFALECDLSRFYCIHTDSNTSLLNKYPGLLTDLESNPKYQIACVQHFKRLILNNVSLCEFKPLLQHRNSSLMLTLAIIELLKKFNNSRKSNHHQLLFYFTTVFRYICAFAISNEINGLMISQHIQNLPFVSPFLLIAMINNIPKTLYLYNLLIPKKLTKGDLSDEEAKKTIFEQYQIVDLSFDNSLDRLIQQVPQILYSFFMEFPVITYEMPSKPDYIDRIISLQLASKPIPETMKVLITDISHDFHPTQSICTGIQMTKYIITFVQRDFARFANDKYFTEHFWKFFTSLLATVLPTISEQFAPRFCELALKDQNVNIAEYFINGILNYCLNIIVSLPYENHFIPFLFTCLKMGEELQTVARLVLMKFIQCDIPRLSPQVIENLKSCDDLVLIVEYIDALQNLTEINQFDDLKDIKQLTACLINKVPFNMTHTPVLLLTSNAPIQPALNNISAQINQSVGAYLQSSSIDLARQLNGVSPSYLHLLIRILSSSSFIQKPEARVLTERTIFMLNDSNDAMKNVSSFPVTNSMLILPVAQHLLRQLLVFKHTDLAFSLIDAMRKPVLKDLLALHWISRFVVKNYEFLTNEIKDVFDNMTSSLPQSDELYLSPSKNCPISDILERIQSARINYHQGPEVIKREVMSPFRHALLFSVISILVRKEPVPKIIAGIVEPLYQPYMLKSVDNILYSVSRLLGYLPPCIGFGVFSSIMQHEVSITSLNVLRVYTALSTIDIFQKICESSSEVIRSSDSRLRAFMYIVMPNFSRLKLDEETATKLLCGLLENVNPNTPRSLQENVIDAVGMVYVLLKLHRKRATLINSSKHFTPELKAIIASSLDIELDYPRSPTPPNKQFSSTFMKRSPSSI